MEEINGVRAFNPKNRKAWRDWLAKKFTSTDPVCLVIYNKKSKSSNISYEEAVEEALCFGWIDNKGLKRDDESMYLQFTPRKKDGNWSKLNRDRSERLIASGLMTEAGQILIDIAKKSGKWDAALQADSIPPDLAKAFTNKRKALRNFESFPPSSKRFIIQWINAAKQAETRQRRIKKAVEQAADNIRAMP